MPFQDRMAAAQKAKRESDAWVRGQEQARNQLNTVILDCTFNSGPNHPDPSTSEMVQKFLKRVIVPAPAGKAIDPSGTDYIATVQWIRAVIQELPDHPKLGDPEKALQRVRDNFAAQAEAKNRPNKHDGW